mgnify:CR=1 FL=1
MARVVSMTKISQKSTNSSRQPWFLRLYVARHGPYYRADYSIVIFVVSIPDGTEVIHRYCADIGDKSSIKYLVTTMMISHSNHLLGEINRWNY